MYAFFWGGAGGDNATPSSTRRDGFLFGTRILLTPLLCIKQIQKHVARVLEEAEGDAEGGGGGAGDDDMGLVELEKEEEEEFHDGVRAFVCVRVCVSIVWG